MRCAPFKQLLGHRSARLCLAQNGQTPGLGAHVRAELRGRFTTKVEKPRTLLRQAAKVRSRGVWRG
ncbi:MAG: hypothetical protein ACI9MR_001929 [Myxococcota bacterium]|jgi:hypothetical protein